MFAEKKSRSPGQSNGLGSGACALSFTLCHCRVHILSHAQCQTLKSRKYLHAKRVPFCNYVPQTNEDLQRRLCIGPSFDHM